MNLKQIIIVSLFSFAISKAMAQTKLYVNSSTGNDINVGSKESPFRTLAAAARKVNESVGTDGVTILMAAGVYAFEETTILEPTKRNFTKENRLTIRAEILPDDTNWNTGSMPTIIHTMPLQDNWFGKTNLVVLCMV
jgi:hypothetical protein